MSIDKEKIKRFTNEFLNVLEGNSSLAKIGCYSVALIGLTVAVRRIRPFSRFKKPSDIPKQFIEERQELAGNVHRIEPTNGLLLINHRPLIPLPFSNRIPLPVKISGIEITRNGISWLQTIVVGNNVKFIPISVSKDWVQCEVTFEQLNLKKNPVKIDVAESLVSVGFAALSKLNNVETNKYYKRLQSAEIKAQRKQLGLVFYLRAFEKFISDLVTRIKNRRPKNSIKLNVVT
ncbi:hypothetical protein FQR65_LT04466 [Abscondita terminalis]|nr:hypothetical protein FQR65_LT04466 [Abscondita terminalis]